MLLYLKGIATVWKQNNTTSWFNLEPNAAGTNPESSICNTQTYVINIFYTKTVPL